MEKDLKLKIFLKKSKLRQLVWDNLKEAKTPTEVAKELKKERSSISRIMIDLEKKGFIECINPEDKTFRHYVKK